MTITIIPFKATKADVKRFVNHLADVAAGIMVPGKPSGLLHLVVAPEIFLRLHPQLTALPQPLPYHPQELHMYSGITAVHQKENAEIRAINAAADHETSLTADLKTAIWLSLDEKTRDAMEDSTYGNRLLSIRDIITRLIDMWGAETPDEVAAIAARLSAPFITSSTTGLAGHIRVHLQARAELQELGADVGDHNAYEAYLTSLRHCGLFVQTMASYTMLNGYSLRTRRLDGPTGFFAYSCQAWQHMPTSITSGTSVLLLDTWFQGQTLFALMWFA
jgi:hypothetical protein